MVWGDILKTKERKKVLEKLDIFMENFGYPKILQLDNMG